MNVNYRYPDEGSALILCGIMTVVVLFGFLALSFWTVVVVVAAGLTYIRLRQGQLLGQSALVTASNFSALNWVVQLASTRVAVPRPRVHVIQNPVLNAFAMGFSAPYSVVLHSALLEHMTDDELLFIVGHELGHIKHGHTRWLSIIAPFGNAVAGLDTLYGYWQRKAEYTADRAGLIACRDLDAAIRAIIKVVAGPPALRHTNVEEFLKQAGEADRSEIDRVAEWFGTHPYVTNRIRELIRFAGSEKYRRIVLAAGPQQEPGQPCPRCGAPTLATFRYCVRCGAALAPESETAEAETPEPTARAGAE